MAGPKYSVDCHPDRKKIIRDITKGELSYRDIAVRYGISKSAISRYLNEKLVTKAAKVAAQQDEEEGTNLLSRIETVMKRMQKLYDACDEYLSDPENPETYTLMPHAHELEIIYTTQVKGEKKMVTKLHKENLKNLIDRLLSTVDGDLIELKYRHADPRKLIIETASTMTRQLELIGKIMGKVKDTQITNVNVNQYIIDIHMIIVKALAKYPEARDRLIKELEKFNE